MQTAYEDMISIRAITHEDTPNILKWRNSPHVMQNFIARTPLTAEMHEHWLATRVQTGEVAQFLILVGEAQKPIGTVYLRDIDLQHKKAEFGIFIGEADAIGKGYGRLATQWIVNYAFDVLKLHSVYLRLLKSNDRAQRLYESVGFSKEDILQDGGSIDNNFFDIIWMRILNPAD